MAQAPRLPPGSIFARDYKVVGLLAEGGMGAVYRAEQLSTRKLRALKLVNSRLASDPKGHERFVREATVGASIDSEHAVEVIGAGIDEATGRPWLAMELLDGADLGAVVGYRGPMAPGQLREVAGQLCHGLAAAHRAGVVHRDLKPANIFVARSRRAGVPFTIKILDFGIAKVVQESGSGATDTDTVGSPLWMAPEQLNAQRPTPATDVWALGLLGFWALTAKHYWLAAHAESSTVQALFVEQLFKPLVPPSQRAQQLECPVTLPPGFDEWFLRCTHRDAPRRYPDARAASEALMAVLPPDPAAAARLLPDVALEPSTSVTETQDHTGESTLATQPTAWGASAVVPASEVAAARTAFEGDSTHPGLGADLSRSPLPRDSSTSPRRAGVSPLAVMVSVALVVGLIVGVGYFAWQRQDRADHSTDGVAATDPPPPPTHADTGDTGDAGDTGPGSDSGSEDTAEPMPGTTSGRSLDPLTDEPEPSDPHLELVVPLRNQLDRRVHDVRFLGWSESGHRFALQAEYRDDKNGKHNRLALIEVRDALTGVMIESFLVSRDAAEGTSRLNALSKAAGEARPQAEWAARRADLSLDKQAPARRSPGGGRLHIESADAPAGTSISFPPSALGVAYRWTSQVDPPPGGPDPRAPAMTIRFEHDGSRFTVLELEPPFSHRQVAARRTPGAEDPCLAGHVLAFWSPDGARVVFVHDTEVRPPDEEPVRFQRWVLRAAGPQIRLVEAGAGQPRTRQLAAQLAAAGLPIALTELRAPPEATSSIVYTSHHDGARELAQQVRSAIPGSLPEPVSKRRRGALTSVKIVLGQDAH